MAERGLCREGAANSPRGRDGTFARRRVIGSVGAAGLGFVAGCINRLGSTGDDGGDDDNQSGLPDLPRVADPPEAVYVPTHREAMVHLPTVTAGEYAVSPMLTQPHRFWLVTGREVTLTEPTSPGVHLMVTIWDPETETVLPVDTISQLTISMDGEVVAQRVPWPMISQTMGFHFGDNFALDEDGTYSVEVDLRPITDRKTGDFRDRFETTTSASFEFTYDEEFRRDVVDGIEYLDEDLWGQRGALEPTMPQDDHGEMEGMDDDGGMDGGHGDESDHGDHTMPFSSLPPAEDYPGEPLGEPTSGDARFVVQYLSDSDVSDSGYLLVSPRTPYNRVPLPDMALSIEGDVEATLHQTLDSEVGFHYGASVDLAGGETIELVVDGVPQVSRHAGYETAFIEMSPMTIEVP